MCNNSSYSLYLMMGYEIPLIRMPAWHPRCIAIQDTDFELAGELHETIQ
jgi:hypothetical protein